MQGPASSPADEAAAPKPWPKALLAELAAPNPEKAAGAGDAPKGAAAALLAAANREAPKDGWLVPPKAGVAGVPAETQDKQTRHSAPDRWWRPI